MTCGDCKYWNTGTNAGYNAGFCHRRAPIMHPVLRLKDTYWAQEGNTAEWPRTHATAWCGEWEAK